MLTIIIAITPVPRLRSGFQRAASLSQPKAAETAKATTTPTITVMLTPPMLIVPGSWSNA